MAITKDRMNDGAALPSELFAKYREADCSEKKTEIDYESLLQNGLSALAEQADLVETWMNDESTDTIPDWLWKILMDEDSDERPTSDAPEFEWYMGARFIQSMLSSMTPFELHSVASHSIVFSDGSQSHLALCMLLCVYSLRQCSSELTQRWKRWQSILCETIRLFQNFEIGDLATPIWVHHVVPACRHVVEKLPSEAFHVGILSGLVGTTSTVTVYEVEKPEDAEKTLPKIMELLNVARDIAGIYGHSDIFIWADPWRAKSKNITEVEAQCEEVAFLQNHHDIAWWNKKAHRHEKVAGMDTSWDELGISFLALVAFEDYPRVYSVSYLWKIWFPHVAILFNKTANYHALEKLPLSLLDSLFEAVPEKSLPIISSTSTKPDAPFETFQILSNLMMAKAAPGSKKKGPKNKEAEAQAQAERTAGLMKSLLTRYQPLNQVKIVRKLVHDCPHPGLQAKFIDLLRPVIFDEEAFDALWSYIGTFVKDLMAHVDKENNTLIHTDVLVKKVEIYVSVVTMVQLWCMVKKSAPRKIHGGSLRSCYKILKRMLGTWTTDNLSLPPDDFYRLYLLEGALEQVLRILEAGKRGLLDDASDSSLGGTNHSGSKPDASTASKPDPLPKADAPVVGDVDIFA